MDGSSNEPKEFLNLGDDLLKEIRKASAKQTARMAQVRHNKHFDGRYFRKCMRKIQRGTGRA